MFMTLMALGTAPALAVDERITPIVLAVRLSAPSVVSIETEQPISSPFAFAWPTGTATSDGSGVIIDDRGLVLTNAHVVSGAVSIIAHDAQGRDWPAHIVGLDADLDLAVLQLEGATGLVPIRLGTSHDLMLGETVIAIGNPYGLGLTVSTGVVSSVSREVEIQRGVFQEYIQTDAAINPGNSGGALVNIHGELIGINTAIFAQAEGIGFSIPVDRAKKIARDLALFGQVQVPWLGVDLQDISVNQLRGTPLAEGAVQVARVYSQGPGDRAGLLTGDLVYKVDGRPIRSRADLNAYLASLAPGSTVTVDLARHSKLKSFEVKSSKLPEDLVDGLLSTTLGISVRPGPGGLVVDKASAQGAWIRSGLRVGDTVVAVNGTPVRSPQELTEALRQAKAGHRPSALFTIRRGRFTGNITFAI
jgi:serine protease Do